MLNLISEKKTVLLGPFVLIIVKLSMMWAVVGSMVRMSAGGRGVWGRGV